MQRRRAQRAGVRHQRRRRRDRPVADAARARRSAGPHARLPAGARPGATSTTRPTPTGWPRPAGSSRPPASAGSPSAAASATCPGARPVDRQPASQPRSSPPTAPSCAASADENADLFWALRGGGGNFGVVTRFEFRLHPVKDVYVGIFFYELDYAADLLRFFREFIVDAPTRPTAPSRRSRSRRRWSSCPAERDGDTFCAAIVHWAGPIEEGEKAMEPFRDLAPVVAEMVGPMPYPALNAAFDVMFPKGIRSYWKGSFVTELPDAAIEQHVGHGPQVPEVSATMHLYPINGACHEVGADETAFAYRHATFAPVIVAAWQDPAVDARADPAGCVTTTRRSGPTREPGGYVNFMAAGRPGRGSRTTTAATTAARRGQAGLRPRQPVPPQPEHQPGGLTPHPEHCPHTSGPAASPPPGHHKPSRIDDARTRPTARASDLSGIRGI